MQSYDKTTLFIGIALALAIVPVAFITGKIAATFIIGSLVVAGVIVAVGEIRGVKRPGRRFATDGEASRRRFAETSSSERPAAR